MKILNLFLALSISNLELPAATTTNAPTPSTSKATADSGPQKGSSKVVLITGASSGIGLAAAYAFQKNGWNVWAGFFPNKPKELQSTDNLHFFPLDVTDEITIQTAVQTILNEDGKIDLLINNAGCGLLGPEECVTIEESQNLFNVNFFGPLRMIQAVLPTMRQQRSGHIITLSSITGVQALPGVGIYSASKFAIEGLHESLAATVSPWGIKVSLVEPHFVNTPFGKNCAIGSRPCNEPIYKKITQEIVKTITHAMPQGQSTEEVAELLVTIATTPHPDFRYQSSPGVTKLVGKTLVDPTGNNRNNENIQSVNRMIKR